LASIAIEVQLSQQDIEIHHGLFPNYDSSFAYGSIFRLFCDALTRVPKLVNSHNFGIPALLPEQ
jgi:hypothetical protein